MPRLHSIGEASKLLGVTIKTIREWDRLGKIRTIKTPGGHRRIPKEEIDRIISKDSHTSYNKAVIYGRVSTNDEEGLVKDLISIVTSFSASIDGKRGGKKVSDKIQAILKSGDADENN